MCATVTNLYRYPVKSMGGSAEACVMLGEKGIVGDRAWALVDEERGGIKGGKRFAALMGMHATFVTPPTAERPSAPVNISLADGQTTQSDDPQVNQILSAAVGAPVSLWPLLPEDQLDHYRRAPLEEGVEPGAHFRELFARLDDEPLPDLSKFPAELFVYESSPGTYFDAFPILLMSLEGMQKMQDFAAENGAAANFDVRRFRPNIVVETGTPGFPESAWVGRTGKLGKAKIKVEMSCPRCVMTTHGFADLPKDPTIMRHLVKANGGDLGVYVSVVEPGEMRVGDEIQWLD